MKIHPASDMHLEFWHPWHMRPVVKVPDCDVLALVGDILTLKMFSAEERGEIWKAFSKKAELVLYLPGNHEFYGSNVDLALVDLLKMEASFPANVKMIQPDVEHVQVYKGRRFLGGTLWFADDPTNVEYERYLGDFSHIKKFKPWVYEENRRTHDFLLKNVREGDVVLTHHLPSQKSVGPKYRSSPLNRFFVFPCDDIIESCKPALWLHGHTHSKFDYEVGQTRVVCNPMGYPDDVSEYAKEIFIDLPEVSDAD